MKLFHRKDTELKEGILVYNLMKDTEKQMFYLHRLIWNHLKTTLKALPDTEMTGLNARPEYEHVTHVQLADGGRLLVRKFPAGPLYADHFEHAYFYYMEDLPKKSPLRDGRVSLLSEELCGLLGPFSQNPKTKGVGEVHVGFVGPEVFAPLKERPAEEETPGQLLENELYLAQPAKGAMKPAMRIEAVESQAQMGPLEHLKLRGSITGGRIRENERVILAQNGKSLLTATVIKAEGDRLTVLSGPDNTNYCDHAAWQQVRPTTVPEEICWLFLDEASAYRRISPEAAANQTDEHGRKIGGFCPMCGKEYPMGAKFCAQCGNKF